VTTGSAVAGFFDVVTYDIALDGAADWTEIFGVVVPARTGRLHGHAASGHPLGSSDRSPLAEGDARATLD
jgi:hypothetical protein